ncbi:14330_t:CDS:2 [Funneliformis mosseae]|uniref:14330_t:CDS:1 n=1 Tax=Funneliformis mosseae TaxID=27381 RepID=A0A9N9BL24_FUNMO|nr:14330_t:CDS:2 [Funneliformis mosseae]
MMKDQFDNLCTLAESKESKIRSLKTIGLIHAGLFMLLLRLDFLAGYICGISRSKMLTVLSTINEFGKKVLPMIVLAWKAKKIISNSIEVMDKNDNKDPLESLQKSCENACLSPS